MSRLYEKAYAKLNLSLDVCGLREDGYHLLRTVMQEISLYDDVFCEPCDRIEIACNLSYLPINENNIVYKVANAFFSYTGIVGGARFYLHKRIPSGAGLGGGSSDGVAALRLLDRMYQTNLSKQQMVELVAPIGADLPFFVYGKTALAEGIGERVTQLAPLHSGAFLLVKPDCGMSTPRIFSLHDTLSHPIHPDVEQMMSAVAAQDVTAIGTCMGNSLQQAGQLEYRFIAPLCNRLLQAGALGAILTGSGSTVYGLFPSVSEAKRAALSFVRSEHSCYVVTPISE